MNVQAEISLYPLKTDSLSVPIGKFINNLREASLEVSEGAMSTLVSGELNCVFAALAEAFAVVAEETAAVLVTKVSNACPKSSTPAL